MIEYLRWDSDFFGYKIGKIKISKTTDFATTYQLITGQQDYKLIYLIVEEEFNTQKLQQDLDEERIKLVDQKVTFSQSLSSENNFYIPPKEISLYLPTTTDEKLVNLSLQSGTHSRFRIDDNFINNEYEKLYTAWIKNSVSGAIADRVIVAYQESEIIGLLTLSFKGNFSDIGILAVDTNFRGQKIGQKLIEKAIYETNKQSINQIKVVTQKNNTVACNFYRNQNFEIEKLEYIYHIWL